MARNRSSTNLVTLLVMVGFVLSIAAVLPSTGEADSSYFPRRRLEQIEFETGVAAFKKYKELNGKILEVGQGTVQLDGVDIKLGKWCGTFCYPVQNLNLIS
jgi:hypothetical protein